MFAPLIWVALGIVGGLFLAFIVWMGWEMTHAEVGVDPFDGLPQWDDDVDRELADMLAAGA